MFDPVDYWLWRGKNYWREERLESDWYKDQAILIGASVRGIGDTDRILEIGCGFGRVTRVIAAFNPAADIVGIDISPDQIEHANANRDRGNIAYQIADMRQYDFAGFDVVVASEVLLHQHRETVVDLIRRAAAAGAVFVHDYDVDPDPAAPEYCFVHDYPAIYAEAAVTAQLVERAGVHLAILRASC